MKDNKLTVNKNLCGVKLFLNLFNLHVEEINDVNGLTKFKILNKLNEEVGSVNFLDEKIKIESLTKIGYLTANFEKGKIGGFKDVECGGLFGQWAHDIKFNIKGKQDFNGNIRLEVSSDTSFGNYVGVCCKLNYLDKLGNNVELKVMNDGELFGYRETNDNYLETLLIGSSVSFNSFMYHIVAKGEYQQKCHCFPYQYIRNVGYNSSKDKKHLLTTSYTIKDLEVIEEKKQLYETIDIEDIEKVFIQSGNLMHDIDKSYVEKITEIINLFKFDDLSFLENLISVSFGRYNDEVKKACFGVDINKIEYYNGATNLIDAYFNLEDNKKEIINDVYKKILKK